ncbi:hypothetical protein LCGC14_2459830 [marine sediment metagenome]|uniref:Uncharacterized protein n=1 Tax=marine sediment metagenome TaxID=412755 RepID=A0A0F9DQS5_9ZZZZ
MDKKIVWKLEDGSIAVTTLAKGVDEERAIERCKPEGAIRMPDMDAKDLPSREFRHKWRHDGQKIFVDNSVADLPEPEATIEERLSALENK